MGSKKKPDQKQKPNVNKELEGLNISINSFGEIQSSFDIDQINEFLNTHVEDKKLHKRGQSHPGDKKDG